MQEKQAYIIERLLSEEELSEAVIRILNEKQGRKLLKALAVDDLLQNAVWYLVKREHSKELICKLASLIQENARYLKILNLVLADACSNSMLHFLMIIASWLREQDSETIAEIEDLSESQKLEILTRNALKTFKGDLLLNRAKSRSRIREVYFAELFPDARDVKVPVSVIHEESLHPNQVDMIYVCAIAAAINAHNIFEFGTYRGQTTCGLASVSNDVTVYTLNLAPDQAGSYGPYIGQFISTSPYKSRIHQIFSDSANFDSSPFLSKMDFIFIDADHSYDAVKNDTALAFKMLRPGGVIVWHDYAGKSPGVYKFMEEFTQSTPVFKIWNTCLIVYIDGINAENATLATIPPSLESHKFTPDGQLVKLWEKLENHK
jgi:predicted O-methyltransferase YrrM